MGNPSAPAYDADKWNDRSTPEERDKFFTQHRDLLVRVKAAIDTGAPLKEDHRFRYEFQVDRRNDFLLKETVAGFLEQDKKLGNDDRKLATLFNLKPQEVPAVRKLMQDMGRKQGYEDYANCYTYAMDDMDGLDSSDKIIGGDTPGNRESDEFNDARMKANNARDYPGYKKAVLEGVLADGAEYAGADAETRAGYYRVAVYTKKMPDGSPSDVGAFDMHYARENKDGGWSHKLGSNPVTDKDKDGNPIKDPKTANLGGYEFLTFVYVPEGGLDVGRKGELATKPGSPQNNSAMPDLNQMASQLTQVSSAPEAPKEIAQPKPQERMKPEVALAP